MTGRVAAGLPVIGLIIFALAGCGWFSAGPTSSTDAVRACNGSARLCGLSLNDVVFPATHNSFASADDPGDRFPEQEVGIDAQLDDGIRGLLIDAYYGIPGEKHVYTDTSRINPALNATLQKELGPRFIAAADRLRARISRPHNVEPRVYLCHGYCELGAVDALSAFRGIKRFLDRHPDEVLIINIEDYVAPRDMIAVIEESGLDQYAYRGPPGPPWPTLGEMIDSGQRVVIAAEHTSGGAPWYLPTFQLFQETPFNFKRRSEMSCRPNRGDVNNSLFLVNDWINTDPKPLPATARAVNGYNFLLGRARDCEQERALVPNLVAVDFYREGNLLDVVRTLNGQGGETSDGLAAGDGGNGDH